MALDETLAQSVRDILAHWASSLPHHSYADFGQKISLVSVSEKPTFILRLMTLYDNRTPRESSTIPYRQENPPPTSAQDIWSYPGNLETDFIRHETRITIPVSQEPESCERCEGEGTIRCNVCVSSGSMLCPDCMGPKQKSCPECKGLGKIACRDCKGTGQVVTSMSGTGLPIKSGCQNCAGTGGPPCPKCGGKIVDCPTCQNKRSIECTNCRGQGRLSCPPCEGQRQVLKARSYLVEYQPILNQQPCPDPETPSGLLPSEIPRDVLGKVVYEIEADKITALKGSLPQADLEPVVQTLLKQAEAGKKEFDSEARIIKQRLTVDRLPVYSVVYEYLGKKYSCWATPFNHRVVAPESPFTALAAQWVQEIHESLAKQKYQNALELVEKSSALATWPWLQSLKQHILQDKKRHSQLITQNMSLGVIFLFALLLGLLSRTSHHIFWPVAVYMALAFAGLQVFSRAGSLIAGISASAVFFFLFWLANPAQRLDAREFRALLRGRFGTDIPAVLKAEDESYLKFLIGIYEPMGVDISPAQEALKANAKRIELGHQEALQRKESQRKRAEEELQKKRKLEALKGSIKMLKPSKTTTKKKSR
ncbi:MAG: hypothetical protein HY400_07515 [Elusimicrobia bacterium]|nr:hypothetical protein [Elusimicrobiota bacterium]